MKHGYFLLLVRLPLILAICTVSLNAQSTSVTAQNTDVSITAILDAVQKNVDFQKKHLVDFVSKEEITVDEFNNNKEKEKTTNIISEYHVFAKAVNEMTACGLDISEAIAAKMPLLYNIMRREREILSVKINGKMPKNTGVVFNGTFLFLNEHSELSYLVLFDKQCEKYFNYRLRGIEKINDRDAYAVEITKKKTDDLFTNSTIFNINKSGNIYAEEKKVETTGALYSDVAFFLNMDEMPVDYKYIALIDAETMDIVQLRGDDKLDLSHWTKNTNGIDNVNRTREIVDTLIPKCLYSKPVNCLPFWEYYRFRYEYGKVKIADQFLTLPISKTIEILRKNERPAAVYKYVFSGFKSAAANKVQALLDSGSIQALRSKMLQNGKRRFIHTLAMEC